MGPIFYSGEARSPLPASASRSYGNAILDWLSEYRGGWQELWPNAGGACAVLGVPLPFHGKASRARWTGNGQPGQPRIAFYAGKVAPRAGTRLCVDAARPVLRIEERVTCEAAFEVPYVWGHHPAWGAPLSWRSANLSTCRADGSWRKRRWMARRWTWRRIRTHLGPSRPGRSGQPIDLSVIPAAPMQRLVYISNLDTGWYVIRNPRRRLGLAVAWDLEVMPCVWLWQEIQAGKACRGTDAGHSPPSNPMSSGLPMV